MTQVQQKALESFEWRRAHAPRQVDNTRLYAGKPMVFYCHACGWVSDIMPEDYFVSRPRHLCSECQALLERGWMPVSYQP